LNQQNKFVQDKPIPLDEELFNTLIKISELINKEFDLRELLVKIIQMTNRYIKAKRISIMLVEGDCLHLVAHVGFNIKHNDVKVKLGEYISGKVAQTGKIIVVNNAKSIREEFGYKAKSYMSIPIRTEERILGVLNITDKKGDCFFEKDINLAKFIANQCALAIERNELYMKIIEQEKISVVGKFTNSIVHDIKNMLNVVDIYLDLLEAEWKDIGEEEADYFLNIRKEVNLIIGYVQDILEFSKNRVLINEEIFTIKELINEVKDHLEILLKNSDIELKVDIRFHCSIKADRKKLFRVLTNLINNAIKALEEKGIVRITVYKDNNFIYFNIFDNGKGIEADKLAYIFEPFVSYSTGGTGLGLALSKQILKDHGGDIKVFSKFNKYTYFLIKLPVTRIVCDG
jgi:K+-sensing histidine kinase KdpD